MLDWLTTPTAEEERLTLLRLTTRLLVALACGVCVAGVYRIAHGRDRKATSGLATTLVLMSVLIALVSIVIGSSVARAFSLVGALSIVRFRTVVDDTRDTAFVIFTVVVGMAAGAGLHLVVLVGIPLVGGAAIALALLPGIDIAPSANIPCRLSVRLAADRDPASTLALLAEKYFTRSAVQSTSTSKQGTAVDLEYLVYLRNEDELPQIVTELSRVDGVLSAELKRND